MTGAKHIRMTKLSFNVILRAGEDVRDDKRCNRFYVTFFKDSFFCHMINSSDLQNEVYVNMLVITSNDQKTYQLICNNNNIPGRDFCLHNTAGEY